jgi:hypothetical protein
MLAPDPTVQHRDHAAIAGVFVFLAGRGGIGGGQQIHEVDLEALQELIGHIRGQKPGSFQHVMDMRLRDPGNAGQAAFAEFSVAHSGSDMGDEPHLEKPEVHWTKPPLYFYQK